MKKRRQTASQVRNSLWGSGFILFFLGALACTAQSELPSGGGSDKPLPEEVAASNPEAAAEGEVLELLPMEGNNSETHVSPPPCSGISPTISSVPATGGSYNFTVSCTGAFISYRWTVNGTLLSTRSNLNYSFPANNTGAARTFTLVVTTSSWGGSSAPIQRVVTQPSTTTLRAPQCSAISPAVDSVPATGVTYTFTTSCTNSPTSYRWSVNGTALGTASSFDYTFPANDTGVARSFTVAVTASNSDGTSAPIQRAVSQSPLQGTSWRIEASGPLSFGTLQAPYSPPAAQTVSIRNAGTEAVTLTQPTATHFLVGSLSTTRLASNGATATFSVQPKASLPSGIYNETIRINGTQGTTATVDIAFSVTSSDSNVKTLKKSTKSSPTNIVFLGDGFIAEDMVDGGVFDKRVAEFVDYIFSIQPFKGYGEYFSVYSVPAISEQRGAKSTPTASSPRTLFSSTYNYMGIERLLVVQNTSKVSEYARRATANPHVIVVIVNDTKFGGSGGQFAVSSVHPASKEVLIHEIGHIFTLADEYVDEQYRQAAKITLEDAHKRPNVDVTNNLSQIKWKHFVGLAGYSDKAWEGGFYFERGVWRPTEHSIMRSYAIMEFNAISRETIVKIVLKNAGETYRLEDFLKRDVAPTRLEKTISESLGYPMPVPVEFYAESLFGSQQIRASFKGETE